MSRGKSLQEMEVKTQQSRTAVNSGAKAGDSMPKMADPGTQLAGVEDLGGPTPDNYRPDDDSAKLKTPGGSLKQVSDVVNKGAGKADSTPTMKKEEEELDTEATIEEDQEVSDEVVAEEEMAEDTIDVEEDVNALLGGEELSEEFREKAKTIFEAALKSKISDVKEQLEAQYSVALGEEVEEMKVELQERVDSYLEYVADEWLQENELAVERGLKTEMTESFMEGMKSLFEEHYVSIPEEKYDVLDEMTNKLDEMEEKLNEQIDKNVSLNGTINARTRESLIAEVSKGLAQTQAEKLASLAESVEFESAESFKEKISTLKENYFPKQVSAPKEDVATGEVAAPVDGAMAAYVNAISQWQ